MILRLKSFKWLEWSIESALRKNPNIRARILSNADRGTLRILLRAAFRYIDHLQLEHFRISQFFESLRLEHEMHDVTSNVNVFEY